jgi:hypothetical protein
MSTPSTNYRESVFRHADLTRIHGEPNFSSLKILSREIKANARSVHSTLGGAAHGHLGLVLSPAQYALVSDTPFERVAYPGPLVIQAGTTRIVADELERNHKEQIRVFREVLGVENALKSQLTKAIEPTYLTALIDPDTYDLQGTIFDNLRFLMATYGKVTPDTLADEFEKVNAIVYNPALPIDVIFNAVVDVSELAEAANIPYTEQQQITMCYNILNRSGRVTQDIKEWNRRPVHLKTWTAFKAYFRRVHSELRETESETLQNMQHANIARQVIEGISHLIPSVEEPPPASTPPASAPAPPAPAPAPPAPAPPAPSALSVTESAIIPSLIQQMNQMQTLMMSMQQGMCGPANGQGQGQGQGRGRNRGNRGGRGGRGGNGPPVFTQYCWTHGLCMHIGANCRTPATGHQATATVDNRMGGSNRNCPAVAA